MPGQRFLDTGGWSFQGNVANFQFSATVALPILFFETFMQPKTIIKKNTKGGTKTVQCKKDSPRQKRQSKPRRQSNARKESKTKRQDTIQHKPL
jgi:hypothetical protein